jgi:hypothetical protein
MQQSHDRYASVREEALGLAMRSVAADIRLIDLTDLVTYLSNGQMASVAALVQSSIELKFKPDTMTFGNAGEYALHWCRLPLVSLDMEFHHNAVHVYFRLHLGAVEAGVEINYVCFDDGARGPAKNTKRLIDALQDALLDVGEHGDGMTSFQPSRKSGSGASV